MGGDVGVACTTLVGVAGLFDGVVVLEEQAVNNSRNVVISR